MNIEWDTRKAKSNIKKHGVSFEEATTVLSAPLARRVQIPITLFQKIDSLPLVFPNSADSWWYLILRRVKRFES